MEKIDTFWVQLSLQIWFTASGVCRAKSARWPRSSWSYVPVLLTRQFAVAGTESWYIERTVSEDWWYQAGNASWSSVQRSGRSVFAVFIVELMLSMKCRLLLLLWLSIVVYMFTYWMLNNLQQCMDWQTRLLSCSAVPVSSVTAKIDYATVHDTIGVVIGELLFGHFRCLKLTSSAFIALIWIHFCRQICWTV